MFVSIRFAGADSWHKLDSGTLQRWNGNGEAVSAHHEESGEVHHNYGDDAAGKGPLKKLDSVSCIYSFLATQ